MPYADMQSYRAKLVRRRNVTTYHERLRVKTLMFHGGRCQHCGFNDMRALQLDHIHGGGYKQGGGKKRNTHKILHAGLRQPHDFQVLCANCNWIKRYEKDEVARQYSKMTAQAVGGV